MIIFSNWNYHKISNMNIQFICYIIIAFFNIQKLYSTYQITLFIR